MSISATLSRSQSHRLTLLSVGAVLLLVFGAALFAQVGGERGIAPVASSTDIDVRGIEVDVRGDNAQDARENGWREAQRIAWERLDGPEIPDSRLETMVAAIVVEEEKIGPRRYIARLGVIFDRQRAGALLGGVGAQARSAPMLTLPVMITGGTQTMFEYRNPWQRAWAEYQSGTSTIDYVRPSGSGGESLLLTYGQTGRRSRAWWNTVLDQFSAADILVPVARLEYLWPGGPVEGVFTARHGPDNRYLAEFTMRADSVEELPAMLERAVVQFDQIFQRALSQGTLRPDPSLTLDMVEISPEIRALIESSRRAQQAEEAAAAGETVESEGLPEEIATQPVQAPVVTAITVQATTPDPRSFDAALTGLRSVDGVRGMAVTSTAIGGTSVVRVDFAGSMSELAAALRANGWQVTEGNNAIAISR
ncbi:heavy-metal-associated domain-containing protein [Alteraurantiacibacter aquimixticola]|uniref:Heavy-metal-associated domain-containing protein n=1 Tax=Alteraurantiacibacter aquimixticola TaxID=2489173 RepID=A0A4T3F316_9SPHN|nr:heavy-metal-associated domain-containing protein [Alteraurantiacibacter aquimixticola]TIX51603.1 heavy-metal-associated domain-containing protein [Alteraurantiacibacter aquimixticola]